MMQNKPMTVLAVTGGIGAGKSTVTAYLRKLGVPVVDADAISHKLTQKNAAGTLAVARAFGEPYVKDGEMDRRALAELVFSDPAAREKLNAILHPMILDAMRRELARLEEKGTRLAVIDVPLLFESGTDALADEIWCVKAPKQCRIERIMRRDHATARQAQARIDAQSDDKTLREKCDFVIDNGGAAEDTRAAIDRRLKERRWLDE